MNTHATAEYSAPDELVRKMSAVMNTHATAEYGLSLY